MYRGKYQSQRVVVKRTHLKHIMKFEDHILGPWLSLALVAALGSGTMSQPVPQRLLVVLLDGFRWDFAERWNLANFQRLRDMSASAGYLTSEYPSFSYPNYYSLMTGLHPESHRMTADYMFSDDQRDYFFSGTNPESNHAHWWEGAEPLWVTATKQGKKTYMYNWPGCGVTIHGTNPTFCDSSLTTPQGFRDALENAMAKLNNSSNPANLAAVYYDQPDTDGKSFGPNSSEVEVTVRNLDIEMGLLLDRLAGLANQVNLIVVSDHGMTSIDPSRVINITSALNNRTHYLTITEAGPLAVIHTAEGYKEHIFQQLDYFSPFMTVHKKEDIPNRMFYKHGKYVGDILCVANLGYVIVHPLRPEFMKENGTNLRGYNGYENTESDMRGIFYATGPHFKRNVQVDSLAIVDIYQMMCDILGVSPNPNNGTSNRVTPLLRT